MSKIAVYRDEWYPVFCFNEDASCFGLIAEVDPETIARWEAAMEAFNAFQREAAVIFDSLGGVEAEKKMFNRQIFNMAKAMEAEKGN